MSSEELNIKITVDRTEADSEVDDFNRRTDEVVSKWVRVKRVLKREIRDIMYTMQQAIGVGKQVLEYFGVVLDPIQESLVNAIIVSLTSAITIHRMLDVSTGGLSAAVTIGLSAGVAIMAWVAVGQAMSGMDESRAQLEKTQNLISSIENLITGGLVRLG